MTTFEHAMFGANLALVTGWTRKQGWGLALMAALAAALADWDGLSILFGGEAYSQIHRVWGHNLFATLFLGAMVGALAYLAFLSHGVREKTRRWIKDLNPLQPPPYSNASLACWIFTGCIASISHLPADMIYSGHKEMTNWPVKIFWPAHEQGYVLPLVAWGDLTSTFLFILAMFAMYRWPAKAQAIAFLALLAVNAYIGFCWLGGGIAR
ncbi:MAG: hypothetical protein EXR99_06750 [Gemmataceae bacterium]|nr:hypothetical protein [Gemmataceae bacterium]